MTAIFAVQDNSGTVSLLTLQEAPTHPVALGDTGTYAGLTFDGMPTGTSVDLPFMVGQVLNATQFGVTTSNSNLADWPEGGEITWLTGANATSPNTSIVVEIDGANAYIDPAYYLKYHASRGNSVGSPAPGDEVLMAAIVKATDYLDQKYRYKGVRLLQTLGEPMANQDVGFVAPWMTPLAFGTIPFLSPSTTTQATEWPRQGVVNFDGDSINGIPKQIKYACAELAYRVLNGTVLQPDYDPNVVSGGAIVSSLSEEVGPLKTSVTYDTKLGIGFFASFPQVDRMLARAGLLIAGGGRTILH